MSTIVSPNIPTQTTTDDEARRTIQRYLDDVKEIDLGALRAESKSLQKQITTARARLAKVIGLISLHAHTMRCIKAIEGERPGIVTEVEADRL